MGVNVMWMQPAFTAWPDLSLDMIPFRNLKKKEKALLHIGLQYRILSLKPLEGSNIAFKQGSGLQVTSPY